MAELTLEIKDRREWRSWLAQNHDSEDVIWLIIMKRSTGRSWLTYPEALEEALCYGWIDSRLKRIDHQKHMIRFSKRKSSNAWSLKNLITVKDLIERGQMTPYGLAVLPADLDGQITVMKRVAEEELLAPADLAKALEAAGLEESFASLSPSHRRAYFHYITQAKRPDTRAKRVQDSLVHIAKKELPMDMTKWKTER